MTAPDARRAEIQARTQDVRLGHIRERVNAFRPDGPVTTFLIEDFRYVLDRLASAEAQVARVGALLDNERIQASSFTGQPLVYVNDLRAALTPPATSESTR